MSRGTHDTSSTRLRRECRNRQRVRQKSRHWGCPGGSRAFALPKSSKSAVAHKRGNHPCKRGGGETIFAHLPGIRRATVNLEEFAGYSGFSEDSDWEGR